MNPDDLDGVTFASLCDGQYEPGREWLLNWIRSCEQEVDEALTQLQRTLDRIIANRAQILDPGCRAARGWSSRRSCRERPLRAWLLGWVIPLAAILTALLVALSGFLVGRVTADPSPACTVAVAGATVTISRPSYEATCTGGIRDWGGSYLVRDAGSSGQLFEVGIGLSPLPL